MKNKGHSKRTGKQFSQSVPSFCFRSLQTAGSLDKKKKKKSLSENSCEETGCQCCKPQELISWRVAFICCLWLQWWVLDRQTKKKNPWNWSRTVRLYAQTLVDMPTHTRSPASDAGASVLFLMFSFEIWILPLLMMKSFLAGTEALQHPGEIKYQRRARPSRSWT